MTIGALLKVIEERDEARAEVRALQAQAKAAAKATTRFRRITKRAKVTAPCVLARLNEASIPHRWETLMATQPFTVDVVGTQYTHYLPIRWPEVRDDERADHVRNLDLFRQPCRNRRRRDRIPCG